MRIGLYPGTFDPITLGHIDIIRRASLLVDRLVIGVAINRDKSPLFTLEERVEMLEKDCADLSEQTGTEIIVHPFENLLINCAHDVGAQVIVRGLRAVADFEYEFQMAGMNSKLEPKIETIFLMASENLQLTSARFVKEVAFYNGKISNFVPKNVIKMFKKKMEDKKIW